MSDEYERLKAMKNRIIEEQSGVGRDNALFYEAVGQRIKLLRASKKLSQRALAQLAGCSDATICFIEQGKTPAALHTFLNIALSLGVSIDLLTGQEE